MKIVHTSDWQFGKTSIPESLGRQESALLELWGVATREGIDEILVVGDVFQRHTPTQEEKDILLSILFEFERTGINLRLIPGNHDTEVVGNYLSLRTFEVLKQGKFFSNIHVYDTVGAHVVDDKYILLVVGDSLDKIPKMDSMENLPVILVYHGIIQGAILENKFQMTSGVDKKNLLSVSSIIDYIALGDIHLRQQMNKSPLAYYSGGLLQHTFGEESAGFLIVEFGPPGSSPTVGEYNIAGIPRLQTVEVDMNDLSVLDSIEPGMITKVRFHGTTEEKKTLNLTELKKKLLEQGCVHITWDFKLHTIGETVRRSDKMSSTSSMRDDFETWLDLLPALNLDRDRVTSLFLEIVKEVAHGRA